MGIEFKELESSNIASAGSEGTTLHIRFTNGSEYVYKDVPEEVITDFFEAESVGRFFHQHIRPVFDAAMVVVDDPGVEE